MAYAVHTQKISVVDAIIDGALGLFGGGQSSTPTWWDSDAHGLSGQRFDAFFVGYDAVRDGHSGRDACWDQVGQATPGPSVQVGPFPVGLETGAVVGTPSGDVTSVSLPEARGLTAQLYATADKTIVPADVFESWAARWFGSDAYILRNGSLDPLTFTFAKYPWSVPLDRAVGAGASAHMSYYYDATAGRSGIFAVITYPHTGAVELALSLPAAGQSSADASEALQEALYFLLDGIQAGLPRNVARRRHHRPAAAAGSAGR